jgi:hypothetical protein
VITFNSINPTRISEKANGHIVCNGEEVVVYEDGEQGAMAAEVVHSFQMEAVGFPDDRHKRSRLQDALCGRSRCSRLHALLLLPLNG